MRMMIPVPDQDASDSEIIRFAGSYDGYADYGGPVELGDVANKHMALWHMDGTLPEVLEVLRACLFFRSRAHRHGGGAEPFTDEAFVMALLSKIREVSGGRVELRA